jgi:hypothetical protein
MPYKASKIPSFTKTLRPFIASARTIAHAAVTEFGAEQAEAFQAAIRDQVFADFTRIFYPESGTNLSPRWLAKKELHHADSRTMIATGHYVKSIRHFTRYGRRGALTVRIGFHQASKARNLDGSIASDMTLNRLARIQEFGSIKTNLPPRKHWRAFMPSVRAAGRPLRREILARIMRASKVRL